MDEEKRPLHIKIFKEEQIMNEEKKLEEKKLEEVTGGGIYGGAWNEAVLEAQDQRYIQKSNECARCRNEGKDACPYNSNIGSYWMTDKICNARSLF